MKENSVDLKNGQMVVSSSSEVNAYNTIRRIDFMPVEEIHKRYPYISTNFIKAVLDWIKPVKFRLEQEDVLAKETKKNVKLYSGSKHTQARKRHGRKNSLAWQREKEPA